MFFYIRWSPVTGHTRFRSQVTAIAKVLQEPVNVTAACYMLDGLLNHNVRLIMMRPHFPGIAVVQACVAFADTADVVVMVSVSLSHEVMSFIDMLTFLKNCMYNSILAGPCTIASVQIASTC